MGHLVQDRLGATLPAGIGDLRAEDVVLEEGDRGSVFHRPRVELRDEQLVVLAERVPVVEDPVVEVEALLGDREELLRIEELGQRLAAEQAQVDAVVVVVDRVVGPGDQRGDVGRDAGGLVERPHAGVVIAGDPVADTRPVLGRLDPELEVGLQVGLVEARIHAVRVVGLELAVEVDLAVDRVDEAMQPLAGTRVRAIAVDNQHVRLGQIA